MGSKVSICHVNIDAWWCPGLHTSFVHTRAGLHASSLAANRSPCRPAPYPRALVMQTGGLVVKGIGAAHYKSFTIDDSAWPPRFCKIELKLEDGTQVGGRGVMRPCQHCTPADPAMGSHAAVHITVECTCAM